MYVGQDIFDMLRRRLHKDSIVWEKQGRKNLYLTEELTFKLKNDSITIIGVKSMGEIVGFIGKLENSFITHNVYRVTNRHLTQTQHLHLGMLMERYNLPPWGYTAYAKH